MNEGDARRRVAFARPSIARSDIDAVTRVLESGWITTGDECAALEEELCTYLGARHVVAMSSCTAALETAWAALGLPSGARVGIPTWTFASTALAPARAGARPVLLDVDAETLNLAPDALAAALGEGLDAVIVVHFGGVPVDARVHELCRQAGIPVVEDAAHALGAVDERGPIGSNPAIGACFSFYATKNLTCAEGGALATDDEEIADFARSYRLHGMSLDAWARYRPGAGSQYDVGVPGIKGNLPDILAAFARSQLARFPELQARRRALVDRYRRGLDAVPGVRIVPAAPRPGSADHLMVVALPDHVDRDAVVVRLADHGVGTSVHFRPLHRLAWFTEHAVVGPGGTPVADDMAGRVLSLPLHAELADDDVDFVCEALAFALRGAGS